MDRNKIIGLYIISGVFIVVGLAIGIYNYIKIKQPENFDVYYQKSQEVQEAYNTLKALIADVVYTRNKHGKTIIDVIEDAAKEGKLNKNNCAGVIRDIDRDGKYDEKIFGAKNVEAKIPTVIIKYNLCGRLWQSRPIDSFIITSEDVMEKGSQLKEISHNKFEEFIPAGIIKKQFGSSKMNIGISMVPKKVLATSQGHISDSEQ